MTKEELITWVHEKTSMNNSRNTAEEVVNKCIQVIGDCVSEKWVQTVRGLYDIGSSS